MKKILIGTLIVLALPFVIAIFTDKAYSVKREITIEKPKQEVFDYIKHLKNQDNYSKWATTDFSMKKTYTGTDASPGFISAWESQHGDVGIGEQEIKKIVNGERVEFELRFKKPFESTEQAYMTTSDAGTGTKVTWGFHGHMDYPSNLMLLFMDFEGMIGDDLTAGLNNLKRVLEK